MSEDFDGLTEQLQDLRHRHADLELRLEDLDPDPLKQFARWMSEAVETESGLPNAMALATADAAGRPSARMVLLKGVDGEGFTFFTNYESRKGRELAQNPHAALVFYWPALERQVCVRGPVIRVPRAESERYFHTRPYTSRLGAWVSEQSRVVESRGLLEQRMRDFEDRFGEEVPLPEHWGGFRLVPVAVEFWRSRANRLHDRFLYERTESGWSIDRLAP